MSSTGRFRYIVVAFNALTGDRVSAGAVSDKTLSGLIKDFRDAGLKDIQVLEAVRTTDDLALPATADV